MVETKLSIGYKILLARKEKGLSKQELAKRIKKHTSSIYSWENGTRIPTRENLLELSQILDKPLEYFTDGEEIINVAKNDNVNLKIIIGFRDNDFTFESNINGFIFEAVPIVSLNGEVAGLSVQEIESQFFVWITKNDKYVVRKCNEIADGRFYLIYDDYELKIVDMKTDANKKQSSNFKPVGKLLKLIRDLE